MVGQVVLLRFDRFFMPFGLCAAFGYETVFSVLGDLFLQIADVVDVEPVPVSFGNFAAFYSRIA
ncbi:hypothetical protein [Paenibacillus durus]|uniref:hypothetical protein n=1 Tax=Paenibacillus durus TaxID=44251 RepID=UPI00046EE34F|nr:hypothetical protein [Paenibacillus durus]